MTVLRLDNAAIQAACAARKRIDLHDTTCPGLLVQVTNAGKASFSVRYRVAGRRRRLRLGAWGSMTLQQARAGARQALAAVDQGTDPQQARASARDGLRLAQAFERFMAEPSKRGSMRKPSTVALHRQLFRDHLQARLGGWFVTAIRPADVEEMRLAVLRRIGKGRARGQAGIVVANRTLALLSAIMGAAERWGELPRGSNPCRGVNRYKEAKRKVYYRPEELAALERVLATGERKRVGVRGHKGAIAPSYALALRLLLWTGCRTGEIVGLRWGWVDLEAACLRLPDTKANEPKEIPLVPQAVELLAAARPRAVEPEAFVCASATGGQLGNLDRVWGRVRRDAGLPRDRRKHDLRHTFASVAISSGVPLAMVGEALGHGSQATTARYAHVMSEPLREAMHVTGDAIAEVLEQGRQVVRLCPRQDEPPAIRKRSRGATQT